MTVRLIVRVANYAEMSPQGGGHLYTYRTLEVESRELESLLRLDYSNQMHAEVIGAELLKEQK
jgi:hypothetical protein